ncbi:hypothetical protein EVAR_42647_1 [Eumeta japonica]|uniref:Uncharacterized protein n=1 Tax=Eumeta variegata TaxID=151549 RepID=A0A4C1WVV8_EUMVA|nr:hypothetical protein EVAR_42647_1 [Eumeta japonica]
MQKLSGNAGRQVAINQRAGVSDRRFQTSPPLWRESNPKPHLVYAAERDQRRCPFCEVDEDFLRIVNLVDYIKLTVEDLGSGKEAEHTAGSSKVRPALRTRGT